MAKKRRRAIERKYVARRIVLVILLLALIGVFAWKAVSAVISAVGNKGDDPGDQVSEEEKPSEAAPDIVPSRPDADGKVDDLEPEPVNVSAPPADNSDWKLLLVNAASPLPDDFSVELETVIDGYQVDARIADPLRRMFTNAREAGIDLMLCSAYRPIEKQQQLFESRVQEHIDQGKTPEEADAATVALTARPGTSEHQTGLAVDIVTPAYQRLDDGYADTPAAKWLYDNAYRYGFVLRYPKNKESITQIDFEPWHYRYVGEEHAEKIKEAGYCLEEYLYIMLNDNGGAGEPEADEEAADQPEDIEG